MGGHVNNLNYVVRRGFTTVTRVFQFGKGFDKIGVESDLNAN